MQIYFKLRYFFNIIKDFDMQNYTKLFLIVMLHSVALYTATITEYITVLSSYLKNPQEMGEIVPFSKIVGKELTKYIVTHHGDSDLRAKKYLEAGGGCGAVSICIAQKLRSCDHLDIIEINPNLCKTLKKRLNAYKNVSIHCCSILDWKPSYAYDGVICTLPFLSLGIAFTKQAISYFKSILLPGAIFSYVDYPLIKTLRSIAYELHLQSYTTVAVQRYMDEERQKYLKGYKTIYQNIPTTNVYHMCFEE